MVKTPLASDFPSLTLQVMSEVLSLVASTTRSARGAPVSPSTMVPLKLPCCTQADRMGARSRRKERMEALLGGGTSDPIDCQENYKIKEVDNARARCRIARAGSASSWPSGG
jgi:hypothetical protein